MKKIIFYVKNLFQKREKDLSLMTAKDFEKLPRRKWNEDIGLITALIILPPKYKHDSGYTVMDFVGVKKDGTMIRLSGCSDVIHIDGIGGYRCNMANIGKKIKPVSWRIDCLYKSKLLRLFCNNEFKVGTALSSFEIWADL